MYVNPFAFGVVATLAALFILAVIRALLTPDDKGEDDEKHDKT